MSAVAIFADQITQGMRIEHPDTTFPQFAGAFTVTQVRTTTSQGFFGEGSMTVVTILGVRDDGEPYHYTAGPNMVWLCHDSGPVQVPR